MSEHPERSGSVCAGCNAPLDQPDAGRRRKWCSERCRKAQYGAPCIDCGAPMHGHDGRGPNAPKRCRRCRKVFEHESAYWTRERIVDAIRAWARLTGAPPSAAEWNPSSAWHPDRARRFRETGRFPVSNTVLGVLGSWNAAIQAAGFTPRQTGCYGRPGESMALCAEIRRRYEAGESADRLAIEYGCAASGIAYRIRKAGGEMRSYEEAQRLRRERNAVAA